ncbi:MAG TPA: LLM class flavin-dependent oxidoreductase, partial [Chloroflexota bacterium]
YHHYVGVDLADWGAVDDIVFHRNIAHLTADQVEQLRRDTANGKGGLLLIGDPDDVAGYLAKISQAGFEGCGMSFVNYAHEFAYFQSEVLSRLEHWGLRCPVATPT